MSILKADPSTEGGYIKDTLKSLLAGFVGVTDNPGIMFVGELVDLYPEAVVICTVRERDSWYRSVKHAEEGATRMSWLGVFFWPIPTLRLLKPWIDAMHIRSVEMLSYRSISFAKHLLI